MTGVNDTNKNEVRLYQELMETIRARFDQIFQLKESNADDFLMAETAGFHGRKIIEGMAFGCLVVIKNGIGDIPRDTRGQWNGEVILSSLEKKGLDVAFPSPSIIRKSTPEEEKIYSTKIVITGEPDKRLTREEIIYIYQRLHAWNHEINPYAKSESRTDFLEKNKKQLWKDLDRLWWFLEKHTISIQGKMFFTVLKDNMDGKTKVKDLSKISEL